MCFIKLQYAVFLGIIFISYNLIINRSFKYLFAGITLGIPIYFIFKQRIDHLLNPYSLNNYYKSFKYLDGVPQEQIGNIPLLDFDTFWFFDDIMFGNYRMFFLPSILSSENSFQFIQSIENILLLIFLIYFFYIFYKNYRLKCIYWFTHLIFVSGLYGIVVENLGTLMRFKFSIVVSFLIVMFYEYSKKNEDNKINE